MSVVSLVPNNALAVSVADLASRIREMADRIEGGEFGDMERVVFVMEGLDSIDYRVYGRQCSKAELVGILEYAKFTVIDGE